MATIDFSLAVRDANLILEEPARETVAVPRPIVPAEITTAFSQGLERINQGDASGAAACFEQIVEMNPDYADARVGLGIAYAIQGRVYPALDHLQEATS